MAPTHVLTPSTFTKATGSKVQSSKRSKSPFGGDWQASQGEMERKIKEQEEQVSSLTQFYYDFLHSYSRVSDPGLVTNSIFVSVFLFVKTH